MRVISGVLKGKNLEGFCIDGTRPTQDRIKESLFSMIQFSIKESVCLDLFAGSGSLGIEALSNGASYVVFNDKNIKANEIIKKNLSTYKHTNYEIIKKDYKNYLETCNKKFDIIFLDPPYDLNCIDEIINIIIKKELLNFDGIIVCEAEFDNFNKEYKSLELKNEKKYGYKFIKIFKKIS